MADKNFNVRIQNKYDTLENWNKSTLVLLEGELAIASYTSPTGERILVQKIGDGEHTFSQLGVAYNFKIGTGLIFREADDSGLETLEVENPIIKITQEEYDKLTDDEKKDKIFLITDGSNEPDILVPSGLITAWYGAKANIPAGWVLCDGNNGTPNLIGKVIVGSDIVDIEAQETLFGFGNAEVEDVSAENSQMISDDMIEVNTIRLYYLMKI